ncbi:hypothetical protein DDZ13_12975 [Coraliomargarita sinensis]|uniref:Uncharacterized protein n=1 Tax=Coraliomargarita sinensis TaxID=2174842 RepID=A0A317ZHT5_9BACT|nr:hypothetical protein [Coraliomargarita sinensis]PXA03329.1 hypothetical protein DDZ13_12975 [Coraliomargarita sinensis]
MNKLKERIVIFLFVTISGGVCGYLYQAGIFDLFWSASSDSSTMRSHYRERAMEPVTKEEFKKETTTGWWVGCAVGAGLGIYFVARPTGKEDDRA